MLSIGETRRMQREGIVNGMAQAGAAGVAPIVDIGMSLGAAGAASSAADDAGPSGGAAAPVRDMTMDIGTVTPVEVEVPDTSDEVFRDDRLSTYALTISTTDWNTLQKTALDEIYVPATLNVDGQTIGKVGVRYKGSYTLSTCFEEGKQVCRKVSLKVKFDEYDSNLRHHGLKRLNFHSAILDHSHLHERLSYKLFRDFGVLAPRSVHARVMINGSYAGLYSLTEEVDGRFTDHHCPGKEGDGTLYKEVWPSTSQAPDYFAKGQQTNEGAPVTKIVSFATELASAKSNTLGQVVSRWMDMNEVLRYLAVHTAVKHWDGPLTFWCAEGQGCINHNYYLYESPSQNRFSIVAWDMDNTFYDEVQTDQESVPAWWEPSSQCIRDGSKRFLPPACDKLVQGFNQLGGDAFRGAMAKLLAGPYQDAALQADIDRWAKQIDEAVKSDPHGSGYEDWKGSVTGLKSAVATFRARAKAVRDGQ